MPTLPKLKFCTACVKVLSFASYLVCSGHTGDVVYRFPSNVMPSPLLKKELESDVAHPSFYRNPRTEREYLLGILKLNKGGNALGSSLPPFRTQFVSLKDTKLTPITYRWLVLAGGKNSKKAKADDRE